jgi:hypothetical protein
MKTLLTLSLVLMAGTGCYASTISWANNMFPASPGVVDLGVVSKSILDDTNTFNLPVRSLDIPNLPDIAAVGFTFQPTFTEPNTLGYKNDGPGLEHGLGITNSVGDAEIRNDLALQIDLSNLLLGTVSLTVDSIDAGEGYRIWGSTTLTGPMTLLVDSTFATGGMVQTQTFDNTYKFFDVTSDTPHNGLSSLVLRSVTANTGSVPEPATLGIAGVGLLAAGLLRRRKRA